jgi:hypothetical protein
MAFPSIRTAIPQRRFQYGDFGVTVLGEIDSGDDRDYTFIAAFVREGESSPSLFVAAERLPPGRRQDGSHVLRVINQAMDEPMDTGDQWGSQTVFVDQALQIGAQMLGLGDETPYPV